MRKIELLSPAGNFECLKAAVNNGANAVYLGGKNFSARAFAGNFDRDELKEAVNYAHLRNVRVFVTLNTLLTEAEFENALKSAEYYYQSNVDALLIQDLGLYYELKKRYPDFELHCSTQMHVHNLEGVRTAKKLGFKRVVLARESTLELIREACKEDIEIETFVHGALCVSYSGQCLMSSATKNRSANKGMCAQCCRLRYELYDEDDHRIKTDTNYLLSPKDMYLLEDIPQLIDAGVASFKIEGRMKSPAYVGYVTGMYRKAIDSCLEGKPFHIGEGEIDELKVLFNRNFSNDLLYGKKGLFGQKTPNHQGIAIGEVINQRNGLLYIHLDHELNQFDGIRINEEGFIVNKLYLNGLLVNKASKGDICAVESDLKLSGTVYLTQDHLLEKKIMERDEKKVPLDMKVIIYPEKNVQVTLKSNDQIYEYISDIKAQKAQKAPLNEDLIKKQFSKLNDTVYQLASFKADTENAFLTVRDLNQIRRDAIECFNSFRLGSFSRNPIPVEFNEIHEGSLNDSPMIQENDVIRINEKTFEMNDVINTGSVYCESERAVISEFGGLLKDYKEKIAYYTLNCSNSHCYEFLQRLGFDYIVLSSELKESQIRDLIKGYEERNHRSIRPYVFVEGDRILMYIVSDPFGKYMEASKKYHLKDGTNSYRIRKNKNITELIEKEHILDIADLDVLPLYVHL